MDEIYGDDPYDMGYNYPEYYDDDDYEDDDYEDDD